MEHRQMELKGVSQVGKEVSMVLTADGSRFVRGREARDQDEPQVCFQQSDKTDRNATSMAGFRF